MFKFISVLCLTAGVTAGPATESYKDQFCTDPRTMTKHAAYTEWADAYSCSRHRCQPGGRNLAIYTVGCKRVEAPESAIECEEVVEDTNMQFPYCCTRLRCLVVVRGEVWTRVLGQPWETLPAAPWSHMYKMKKPPPSDEHFGNKNIATGPIYEIQPDVEQKSPEQMLRASKKVTPAPDCDEPAPRAAPPPDIVIALSTSNDENSQKSDKTRHKRVKKPQSRSEAMEENREHNEVDFEDTPAGDKVASVSIAVHSQLSKTSAKLTTLQDTSDEKTMDGFGVTQNIQPKVVWTEIPQNQWNEHDPAMDIESQRNPDEKKEKSSGLQALVDAIGNRMRDIENVVQRMTEKVHNKLPESDLSSSEKRSDGETDKRLHKEEDKENIKDEFEKPKKPNNDNDHYKRFTVKNRGSKYLRSATEGTSEQPLFVEDTNLNGYFSDASNSVVRRAGAPKANALTYVAPVDSRRAHSPSAPAAPAEPARQRRRRARRRRRKNKSHKKHHGKEDKKKHFNKLSSSELDKNIVSLEDSSIL
ncbi:uncharacterized protein LOC124540920 [Vanessa cardui]|uniref:uncharacterized protein LOC124540920 n=1 Tax=Vanessa cardui TaxID=171605 RepID=UPI001F12E92E|nr:uncharacterized protein LOC124540920 [Vanessa cardui]